MKVRLTKDSKGLKELLTQAEAINKKIIEARKEEYERDLQVYSINKARWFSSMYSLKEPKLEYYDHMYQCQENVCFNLVKLVTLLLEEKIDEVILDQKDLVKLELCKRNQA